YAFEAFLVPTSAMAPTLLGEHLRSVCSSCGGTGYLFASGLRFGDSPPEELGICGRCKRASKMKASRHNVFQGDRLRAAKFLHPRSWDLVVFRFPEDPSSIFVSRLVGLPGEDVAIRDGDLWINGARTKKPAPISGLTYVADPTQPER